jgi:hypothetical protein
MCFNIFEPVYDQVQRASVSLSYKRRKHMCSETSLMAGNPTSINDLPDEIILQILSFVGPEDLALNIAKVCEKWNDLAKDITLWKTLSYACVPVGKIGDITEVRSTALLGYRTKYLMNLAPSSV